MLENRSAARRVGVLDRIEPFADIAAVAIRALAPEARFVLRLSFADALKVGGVAGVMLDLPINTYNSAGQRLAARLGPDEWLLIAPEADAELVEAEVSKVLEGKHHALVDVSHRNTGLVVAGAGAAAAINAGCPVGPRR